VLIEVLEFVVLLILNMLLTFIVLLQDYCIATIKLAYYKIILATAILIPFIVEFMDSLFYNSYTIGYIKNLSYSINCIVFVFGYFRSV
jgi:hypothetical protein